MIWIIYVGDDIYSGKVEKATRVVEDIYQLSGVDDSRIEKYLVNGKIGGQCPPTTDRNTRDRVAADQVGVLSIR